MNISCASDMGRSKHSYKAYSTVGVKCRKEKKLLNLDLNAYSVEKRVTIVETRAVMADDFR